MENSKPTNITSKEDFIVAVGVFRELIDNLPDEEKNVRVVNIRSALAIYTNYDLPEVKLSREKEALRVRNFRIAQLEAELKLLRAGK